MKDLESPSFKGQYSGDASWQEGIRCSHDFDLLRGERVVTSNPCLLEYECRKDFYKESYCCQTAGKNAKRGALVSPGSLARASPWTAPSSSQLAHVFLLVCFIVLRQSISRSALNSWSSCISILSAGNHRLASTCLVKFLYFLQLDVKLLLQQDACVELMTEEGIYSGIHLYWIL